MDENKADSLEGEYSVRLRESLKNLDDVADEIESVPVAPFVKDPIEKILNSLNANNEKLKTDFSHYALLNARNTSVDRDQILKRPMYNIDMALENIVQDMNYQSIAAMRNVEKGIERINFERFGIDVPEYAKSADIDNSYYDLRSELRSYDSDVPGSSALEPPLEQAPELAMETIVVPDTADTITSIPKITEPILETDPTSSFVSAPEVTVESTPENAYVEALEVTTPEPDLNDTVVMNFSQLRAPKAAEFVQQPEISSDQIAFSEPIAENVEIVEPVQTPTPENIPEPIQVLEQPSLAQAHDVQVLAEPTIQSPIVPEITFENAPQAPQIQVPEPAYAPIAAAEEVITPEQIIQPQAEPEPANTAPLTKLQMAIATVQGEINEALND